MDEQLIGEIAGAMISASGLWSNSIILFASGVLFFIAGYNARHHERRFRTALAWMMIIAGPLIVMASIVNHLVSVRRYRAQAASVVEAQRGRNLNIYWELLARNEENDWIEIEVPNIPTVTFYEMRDNRREPSRIILYTTREVAKAIVQVINSQNILEPNIPSAKKSEITKAPEGRVRASGTQAEAGKAGSE